MRALVLAWQEETGGVGGISGLMMARAELGVSPLVSSSHLWGMFGVGEEQQTQTDRLGFPFCLASTRSSALRSCRPVRLKETANARNFPFWSLFSALAPSQTPGQS